MNMILWLLQIIGIAATVATVLAAHAPISSTDGDGDGRIDTSKLTEDIGRHHNIGRTYYHWSQSCPSPDTLDSDSNYNGYAACCCSITDHGAVGDNSTLNTIAIQSTIDTCHETCHLEMALSTTTDGDGDGDGDSGGDGDDNSSRNYMHINSDTEINTDFEITTTNTKAKAKIKPQQQCVIVYVPPGMFRTGSVLLRSNMRFHLGKGASIYGSDNFDDYPVVPMLPNGYETHKNSMWRALFAGYHIENVSITGENEGYASNVFAGFSTATTTKNSRRFGNRSARASASASGNYDYNGHNDVDDSSLSVIDGVGWKWWCKSGSMPIPQSYCQEFNPNNETIPKWMFRPKLIEFHNSTNIVLDKFTARNSPVWFIHPYLSKNIVMTNLTILAPRAIGNTDGLDPDSCENVLIDSCYIDVGDDGISIKSTNYTHEMAQTRNVTMRNLRIVSRNWCIGSATFGGVYDVLFEDSTIGNPDMVTSPWAIKFKSHRYYPGPMENITIRRIEMGKFGPTPWMYPTAAGSAFLLGLSYGDAPPSRGRSGKPLFRNVTFEDITVVSAGVAGQIQGVPEDCLEGLTLRNISVKGGRANWICNNVNLDSLTVSNIHPAVSCTGGCSSSSSSSSIAAKLVEMATTNGIVDQTGGDWASVEA